MNIERQHGSLCGLHALNNVFQRTHIRFWSSKTRYNEHLCADRSHKMVDVDEAVQHINSMLLEIKSPLFTQGGTYAYDVLCEAIKMAGYHHIYSKTGDVKYDFKTCLGALVHVNNGSNLLSGHWVTVTLDNDTSVILDSMVAHVIPFSDWYTKHSKEVSCFIFVMK